MASFIGLLIDLLIMYILVTYFSASVMLAKIAATGSAFFFNYASRQFFIFSSDI
jgi:putative flippase GtrA